MTLSEQMAGAGYKLNAGSLSDQMAQFGIQPVQKPVQTPTETPVPGAETAVLPASSPGENPTLQGMGDVGRAGANAFGDVWNLLKGMTYGTAKTVASIPGEAINLIKESPHVSDAVSNFAKALPEETIKTLWGFVPQSAKELANTEGLAQIPKEFQQLAKESGGYASAFVELAKSVPESVVPGLANYVKQIDRARQAVVNHPVYEALGYLGLKTLVENPKAFSEQTKQGFKSTGEFINSPIESLKGVGQDVSKIVQNKIIRPLSDKFINQEKSNWVKPTETAKPGYNNATEIYQNAASKGHDISATLINDKIQFSDHIQEGNYDTAATAEFIRADAAKMSKDILRPSLKIADPSVERTPVTEIIKTAESNIRGNKYITPEVQNSLIGKLKESATALEGKYPNGFSLTDLLDEKILRDANSKYSPVGDIATNAEAIKNKAIADATRQLLDAKTPADLPIKDFNAELAKQYQAADYLDALHGKKAPVSIVSRIAKTTAKVIGAAIGHHLGGGVLGGVGGYHIGGMLETTFEGLPNPIKGYFLDNLERTNPQAFVQVKNYLGEQAAAWLQRKQLPQPSFIAGAEYKGGKSGFLNQEQARQMLEDTKIKDVPKQLMPPKESPQRPHITPPPK